MGRLARRLRHLELNDAVSGLRERLPPGVALRLEATDSGKVWVVRPEGTGWKLTGVGGRRRRLLAWLLGRHSDPDLPELAPWQREHRHIR